MKRMEPARLRDVALIGHGSAGKTTLGEALLLVGGTVDRLGRVEDGTSNLDFEPEELKRRISLSTAFGYYQWKGHHVHLIDTPGSSSFLADGLACLRAADGAVLVVEATSGIKVQAERLTRAARELEIPIVVYVSKMDRERANFEGTVEELRNVLKLNAVPIQVPIGQEDRFLGVVDLLRMKALRFAEDGSGKVTEQEIPDEVADAATLQRERLVEAVAESNDELLEKYLEGGTLTPDEIESSFRRAVLSRSLTPVLCGAATRGIGLAPLMDLVNSALPAPTDRPDSHGKDPKTGAPVVRKPALEEPFSAQVLKTLAAFAGNLSVFKVRSGKLEADSTVLNSSRGGRERIAQIFQLDGKKQIPVGSAVTGDIVAVQKFKDTRTGDTLCDEKSQILYDPLPSFSPAISFAIQPRARGDEEKIVGALNRLMEEDPTIRVHRDAQTLETLLSGMGQMHVEVVVEKLKRKFNVEVDLKEPKVPYRETIKRKAEGQGKYKRQTGGRGQYGDAWLRLEPLAHGSGFEFVDGIVGGVVPKNYIPAIEKGVVESMEQGVYAGYPVVDLRVTLYFGSYHDVDSSDMAFKIAASMGFKRLFLEAGPCLLEPILSMEVAIPDEFMGEVNGDIIRRRGRVMGIESRGSGQVIKAQVPMSEVLKYSNDLKAMTSDRGDFTVEFSHYEELPSHLAEKIVAAAKEKAEKA